MIITFIFQVGRSWNTWVYIVYINKYLVFVVVTCYGLRECHACECRTQNGETLLVVKSNEDTGYIFVSEKFLCNSMKTATKGNVASLIAIQSLESDPN